MFNDILILDLFYKSHLTNQLKIGGNIYMGNFCTQCGRPLQEGEVCNALHRQRKIRHLLLQIRHLPLQHQRLLLRIR